MALEVTRAAPRSAPPPADPATSSNLPRSVRDQIARADAIQQSFQPDPPPPPPEGQLPATPEPTPGTTPVPSSQAGAQPQAPAPQAPNPNGAPLPNGEAPPGNGTGAPHLPPQPVAPSPSDADTLAQQLRSLEGRYRADMERSAQRQMQLERELTMRSGTPAAPAPADQPLLTPEEVAEYGPEFVDVVRRVATEAARPLQRTISALQGEIEASNRRIAVSANDQLHQFMNANLPDWATINNSAEFIVWSRLPDIYSGAIRQELMQDAWNRGDGPRVLAFFNGFLAELQVRNPQGTIGTPAAPLPQAQPAGSPAALQPRVTLESLAAPGRARSASPMPADKPVYTQTQILKFYTDVATGRFQGTPEDRVAIDRDIIAAQSEGRIILDNRLAAQPPAGFTR